MILINSTADCCVHGDFAIQALVMWWQGRMTLAGDSRARSYHVCSFDVLQRQDTHCGQMFFQTLHG